jgi:hypothetical protein
MAAFLSSVGAGFRTIGELLRLFGAGGRWWLFPLVVFLLLFGVLLLLASATPIGPFIYTLF